MAHPEQFRTRNFLLQEALRLAEEHGVAREDVLAKLGRDWQSMARDGGVLPAGVSMEVIELAADLSGRPDFGLALGLRTDTRLLATIVVFLAHCTTLAQMCSEVSNYMHILYGGLRYWTPAEANAARVHFEVVADAKRPLPHFTDTMLVLPVRLFREILGVTWSPVGVHIAHAPLASPERYRDIFGCDVVFGSTSNAIGIDPQDWHRKIDIRTTRVQEIVDDLLDTTQTSQVAAKGDLLDRVREVIGKSLPSGNASASRVAALLNMSMRSMQRGIAGRGTTFTDLRREVEERFRPGHSTDAN